MFSRLLQPAADKTINRIPPPNAVDEDEEPANPVISSLEVSKFVNENSVPVVSVQRLNKMSWHDELGMTKSTHERLAVELNNSQLGNADPESERSFFNSFH